MMESRPHESIATRLRGNRFDRMEWTGAFGELGTLIPFVVAYLSMLSLGPFARARNWGSALLTSA